MRETKGRDDRCDKKESRERQWDPLCVNWSTGLVNAPNMNYFSQKYTLFLFCSFVWPHFLISFPLVT